MPQFTKGRWVFPEGKTCISTFDSDGCVERNIAEVFVDMPTPEFEANARLIVEAPNMYELLNRAFHVLCEHNLDETLRLDIDAALCHVENYPVPGEDDEDFEGDNE